MECRIEALDPRKLLSVSLSTDGTLFVQGTAGSDHITLYRGTNSAQRLHVKVNGQIRGYNLASITRVMVKAGNGRDRITIDQSFGVLTLPLAMAVRRSSVERPRAASATGLARTRTAGFMPPLMVTRPTPESCESFGTRRLSAKSCTCVSGSEVELSASVAMGVSAGLTLL